MSSAGLVLRVMSKFGSGQQSPDTCVLQAALVLVVVHIGACWHMACSGAVGVVRSTVAYGSRIRHPEAF